MLKGHFGEAMRRQTRLHLVSNRHGEYQLYATQRIDCLAMPGPTILQAFDKNSCHGVGLG
jgi:hypothetical protein